MNEREPDSDTTTPPRKRIAVACTRCRKRKIRCSGDPGNGLPCHNCKNAGAEPCQFLRVASQETAIIPPERGFAYDIDSARSYQVRGGIPSPFSPPYTSDLHEGLGRYPSSSIGYSSPGRYQQNIPSWASGYCDDGADYSNMGYQQSYYSQDPAYMYRMASTPGRSEPSGMLYGDGGAGYNYGHRPAVSGDSPSFSLSSVAASLPGSSDRLLPTPVNRTLASSGASIFRADEASPYSYKSQNGATTLPSPVVSASEEAGAYVSCESSPAPGFQPTSGIPSINGSSTSTSTGTGTSGRLSVSTSCAADGYSSSSSIFSNADLRTPTSGSDLSYDYSNPIRRAAGPPLLSNGQPYKVPQQPTPSMPSQSASHHDLHSALSAAAYLMSGVGNTGTTGGPGTELSGATAASGAGAAGSGGSAAVHADLQRRTTAGGLPAA